MLLAPRYLLCRLSFAGAMLACSAPLAAQLPTLDAGAAVAHFHAIADARAHYDAGRFAEAEAIQARLVAATPEDGELHYLLGRSRERLGDITGAIEAYRAAFLQGAGANPWTAYRLARMYTRLGQRDSALTWLERSLVLRYEDRPEIASDTAFAAWHGDPRFRRITGLPATPPPSRIEGWRNDIEYLVDEARRMHAGPSRPAHSPGFDSAARALHAAIPRLTDAAVVMRLHSLLVRLGDGHSGIYGPGPGSPLVLTGGRLPVEMRRFADGLFIIDATDDAQQWIGARVDSIGDLPAQAVLDSLLVYMHHDTPMTALWLGEHFMLPTSGYLEAIGAKDAGAGVRLVLRERDGPPREVTLEPSASAEFPRKLRAPPGLASPPRYLQRVGENYWFESLPQRDAVYFQFNQVRDAAGGPSIAQFADSLRHMLTATDATRLVIDVRHNNGGNNSLVRPLLRMLTWWELDDPRHRLFVITGRGTFSAAQNFINRVERLTNALFVGEPSSSSPNFVGEETNLRLPWSRVVGSISTRYWQDSNPDDTRPYIWPDLPVGTTSADYFTGRDPALEAIWLLTEG